MIYLNPTASKILDARDQFLLKMKPLVLDRINSITDSNVRLFFDFFITPNLERILGETPDNLRRINNIIQPLIEISSQLNDEVKKVFKYDWFIDKRINRYDAYNLADDLGVVSCVYCNRNYTNTIIEIQRDGTRRKLSRSQFDHYFDKGSNPLLALSFYNLIPSCSTCNSSIKHSASFSLTTHNHPYIDDKINEIKFSYVLDMSQPYGIKITVNAPYCVKTQKNLDEFAIEQVYNVHQDILSDLLKTKSAFSERYLTILRSSVLKSVILSDKEIYRIVFGTEQDSEFFVNRPFSKFKKDILIELGITSSL